MAADGISRTRQGLTGFAVLALIGTLLVPLAVITAPVAGSQDVGCVSQGVNDDCEVPVDACGNEIADPNGATQGRDSGHGCCPDGSLGHWEWGGYAGQNLYWCDAPPDTPPATAPPTTEAPTAVSPTTEAPKKAAPKKAAAAAAKPTFTG